MASSNVLPSVEPDKPCLDTKMSQPSQLVDASEPIVIMDTCPVCFEEIDPCIYGAHVAYCSMEAEDQEDEERSSQESSSQPTPMPEQPLKDVSVKDEEDFSDEPYFQSSEDEDYIRPKRVKCLTKDEIIMEGLTTGKDAPLKVREGIAGRGVFATASIVKGSWLCEFKATKAFPASERAKVEEEYDEGCCIIQSVYDVPSVGQMCWDATTRYHQIGKYLNNSNNPNAELTRPHFARKKWRIGFTSSQDIEEGDEVVWDWGMKGEVQSGCRLVGGMVQPRKTQSDKDEGREHNEGQEKREEEGESDGRKASVKKRKLCMCPLCGAGPLRKLSNHLSQVHHMNPKERGRYLGLKRVFATAEQIQKGKRPASAPPRKSQRLLTSMFKSATYQKPDSDLEIIDSPSPSSPSQSTPSSPIPQAGPEQGSALSPPSPPSPPTPPSPFPSSSYTPTLASDLHPPSRTPTLSSDGLPSTSRAPPKVASKRPVPVKCAKGTTRKAGRFDLDEPFLVTLDSFLGSRLGGKKDHTQRREIAIDVSKFLYFANSTACDPDSLLNRSKVHDYITWSENEGIGPSGLLTKIRRIEMALQCLCFEADDSATQQEVSAKRDQVKALFDTLRTSLKREKGQRQQQNLDEFSHNVPNLEDVTKFLTDSRLTSFLKRTVELAQSGAAIAPERLKNSMIVVAGRLLLRNGQRPGVITGMKMEEYDHPSQPTPGTSIFLVREHKVSKPARVIATGESLLELQVWVNNLRPLYLQEESPYVFCNPDGQKLTQLSKLITDVSNRFNMNVPPATVVRKAIATAGGELGEQEKVALAHSMSHSKATADTYYRAYGEAKNLQGFQAVGKILDIPLGKKRQRFTQSQTDKIAEYFSEEIAAKVQPSGEALDRFLIENKDMFPGRKRGDIYSKVRNLIGRK